MIRLNSKNLSRFPRTLRRMNKTTDDHNSSPLSDFMKEMRISSTNYQIVADNPRSKSLWPYREKSLDTADADKESQRWQATANGSQSSGHTRASSFDEISPLTPTEFSKLPRSPEAFPV
jgi:hypothetical protein